MCVSMMGMAPGANGRACGEFGAGGAAPSFSSQSGACAAASALLMPESAAPAIAAVPINCRREIVWPIAGFLRSLIRYGRPQQSRDQTEPQLGRFNLTG